MEKIKYPIPKYKQNFVCFSACLVNALWHFRKDLGSLRNLELEITKKATALPYLYILMPKLGQIAIEHGLSATLLQTKKDIPDFKEAIKEYKKWNMKFYTIESLNEKGLSFKEEEITEENYNYIKNAYLKSFSEAVNKGLKFKVIEKVTPEILLEDLEQGNLSIWIKMLDSYGHSNLLYGYDKSKSLFYFFDPISGGNLVKFKEVDKYLECPVMEIGLSIGPKSPE